MLKFGLNNIGKVFLGNTEISKVFLGTDLVFNGGGGEPTTDLTGWTLGKGLTSANGLTTDSLLCVSPFYPTQEGTVIKVKAFNTIDYNHLCKFISTKSQNTGTTARVAQDSITTNPYQVTIPSTALYFHLACIVADIDDCYIYDVTNSTYLWKGKNVT